MTTELTVSRSLTPSSGPSARWPGRSWAFSLTVSAAIFGYLVISGRGSNQSWPGNRSWLRLAITGMIVFFLGYSIFLVSARILFTSTGINNRVAIAGSLGFAISVVAAIGWVAGLVGRRPARKLPVFSFLVRLLCYSSLLLVNALGGFWAESWRDHQRVLADIEAHLPPPDKGSAVIIDGVCPYIGPAIVFESNWDVAGALEVLYGDPSIRGDVTSANLEIGRGLTTTLYGDDRAHYRYGHDLILYDPWRSTAVRLPEPGARRYLARVQTGCPKGAAGYDEPIFPLDVRFRQLELWYVIR